MWRYDIVSYWESIVYYKYLEKRISLLSALKMNGTNKPHKNLTSDIILLIYDIAVVRTSIFKTVILEQNVIHDILISWNKSFASNDVIYRGIMIEAELWQLNMQRTALVHQWESKLLSIILVALTYYGSTRRWYETNPFINYECPLLLKLKENKDTFILPSY